MDDDQKWLEAAAAIEQDIHYLKAALREGKRNGIPSGLEQEILQLKVVLGIYRKNAAHKVVFPHPDDLYCISALPHGAQAAASTAARRDYRIASL
jgi:hypothetical protein